MFGVRLDAVSENVLVLRCYPESYAIGRYPSMFFVSDSRADDICRVKGPRAPILARPRGASHSALRIAGAGGIVTQVA